MYQQLIDWVLNIPQVVASFGSWLIEPIKEGYFNNVSPLGLFSIAGVSIIIAIIGVHVVRLFV